MTEAEFKKIAEECMRDENQIDQDILSMDQEDMVDEIMILRKAMEKVRRDLEEARALIGRLQFGVKKD
jgi:Mg2+ and Co2+ transporter CorA